MKYFTLFLLLIGCTAANENNYNSYGVEISKNDAMAVSTFLQKVDTAAVPYKVEGTVEEVCQMKGCWMTLKNDSGATIRITFKDYGFFVPKDINGKKVIVQGMGSVEMLDEEVARHYADDGGKAYDESMRNSISLVAHGVLVAKS